MRIYKYQEDSVDLVVENLRNRDVVIIPSDTIYGFSGLAPWTEDSIKNIKGRDENKPFIQLIAEPDDIFKFTNVKISPKLLAYWPGPVTIVVPLAEDESKTVGFRCPNDDWLREIIRKAGFPIYSTSVNYSGQPSYFSPDDIVNEFESQVSLIVDDGDRKNCKPSTIVIVGKDKISVLRQGEVEIDVNAL